MKWILLALLLTGCTHSQLMRDCKKVINDDGSYTGRSDCKTLKPWE